MIKNIVKKLYWKCGSFSLIRKAVAPFRGKAAVLMYHRVLTRGEMSADPLSSAVSVERFREQMEYLSSRCRPVAIGELEDAMRREGDGKLPVAVTFDDGYRDNLTHALPVLEACNVPAAIYIATRFPEGDCGMWWREMTELIGQSSVLSFRFRGRDYSFNLSGPKSKVRAALAINRLFYRQDPEGQNNLLTALRGGKAARSYADLCLTWQDIALLGNHRLITIGSHTHSHVNLGRLNAEQLSLEMARSKELLEIKLGKTVEHLAYPYGHEQAAGKREYQAAQTAGYRTAVTTRVFPLRDWKNPTALPRLGMRETYTAEKTDILLGGWANFLRKQIH